MDEWVELIAALEGWQLTVGDHLHNIIQSLDGLRFQRANYKCPKRENNVKHSGHYTSMLYN